MLPNLSTRYTARAFFAVVKIMASARAHGLDWKKVTFFALLFLYVSISAGKLDGTNLVARIPRETNEVKGRRLIIQDQLDGPWKGHYKPPSRPPPPPPPRSPSHCPPPSN